MQTKTLSLTRILLLCGAIVGPLFVLTVFIQDYTRPAFDPRLQAPSLLGDWSHTRAERAAYGVAQGTISTLMRAV
jgi:hypothetical protein